MKKLIAKGALLLSIVSSLALAEGGADRLQERNEIRIQEAMAEQEKSKSDTQNTAKSEDKTNSESS